MQSGFGNHFQTEAIPGTLPQGQNAPQHVAGGLYTEQISGTAFTAPRHINRRSWLYRIMPSVVHSDYTPYRHPLFNGEHNKGVSHPQQQRWSPPPQLPGDLIDGLLPFAVNTAGRLYLYSCNQSMARFAYSADGEWLFIPQQGVLTLRTECGSLHVTPGQIGVIPRGMKWQAHCDGPTRGYVLENTGPDLQLPYLGPIGANGLANPRDFLYPKAAFEDCTQPCQLLCKYADTWWQVNLPHSPLDVVAWHGNLAPYQYDLAHFNAMNTVSFDHPDPSIFTVLTSPSEIFGTANLDFVIFPPRWMVAEHTFRPPYYHRNVMSEWMGLIRGAYDAKPDGFVPGGVSLHNTMTPHGPDTKTTQQAQQEVLKPKRYTHSLAFMVESRLPWQPTHYALNCAMRHTDYLACWQQLPRTF